MQRCKGGARGGVLGRRAQGLGAVQAVLGSARGVSGQGLPLSALPPALAFHIVETVSTMTLVCDPFCPHCGTGSRASQGRKWVITLSPWVVNGPKGLIPKLIDNHPGWEKGFLEP